ncbi:MAG: hypothetical protein V4444_00415 [Pseudomonadota bacterium]
MSKGSADDIHCPNPRLERRKHEGVIQTVPKRPTINARIAVMITNAVGTMWCAYAFALLALISLPAAITGGTATLISWIAQTFLQLVLLSIIMVGQRVAAEASDKQAYQTYMDAEALLQINDEVHRLLKVNNRLTKSIHDKIDRQ